MATKYIQRARRQIKTLLPTTMLGRLTLFLVLLRLIVGVAQGVTRLAGYSGDALDGWATFFDFAAGIVLALLVLRWVRRVFMWRLRNRLIVTYVFIGVIPVALLAAMVGIGGYLIFNQYATSQARLEMEGESRSLDVMAGAIIAELSPKLASAKARAQRTTLAIPPIVRERFHGVRADAWHLGKHIATSEPPSTPSAALPPWVKGPLHTMVLEQGKLSLRTILVHRTPEGPLVVVIALPLDNALLERTAVGLGRVKIYRGVEVEGRSAANGAQRSGLTIRTGGDDPADAAQGRRAEYEVQRTPAAVGGQVPASSASSSAWWDPQLSFWTVSPYWDWERGEEIPGLMNVTTRLSTMVDRLFTTTGRFATTVLSALLGIAILFALLELVAIIFGIGLTRTMTQSIYNLYEATRRINRGDLKHRIQVKSHDQLAALQSSFNSMTDSLEQLIREQKEKERLENELAIAQEVQETLFPRHAADLASLELHGICRPARTVSGDYYDFLYSSAEQLGIALGDISGKGISAALLMATVHSAVRAYGFGRFAPESALALAGAAHMRTRPAAIAAGALQSPAEVLHRLNNHLYFSTQPEKYATMFLATWDGGARTMTYCNAGHLPPVLIGNDGGIRRLEAGGMVIGLFDDMLYEEASVTLRPGEIFLAFSDGITEPENEFGEFGEERLIDLVRQNRRLPLARISEIVTTSVLDWIGSSEQPDDVTLVLARAR